MTARQCERGSSLERLTERRTEVRYLLLHAAARIHVGRLGERLTGRIVDASRGGVRLEVEATEKLRPGDDVACELEIPEALCKVVPAHPAGTVLRVQGNLAAIRFSEGFRHLAEAW